MAFGDVLGLVSAMFLPVDHSPCQIPAAGQSVCLRDRRYCGCLPVQQLQQPAKVTLVAGTSGTTQLR